MRPVRSSLGQGLDFQKRLSTAGLFSAWVCRLETVVDLAPSCLSEDAHQLSMRVVSPEGSEPITTRRNSEDGVGWEADVRMTRWGRGIGARDPRRKGKLSHFSGRRVHAPFTIQLSFDSYRHFRQGFPRMKFACGRPNT